MDKLWSVISMSGQPIRQYRTPALIAYRWPGLDGKDRPGKPGMQGPIDPIYDSIL
jgi:hypothetical protein